MENVQNGIISDVVSKRNYSRVYSYRRRLKERLVNYKGGKCSICGYDKCISALDFHHMDPKEKDFNLSSSKCLSFERCKQEVDKCILVCANCHREIHENDMLRRQKEREEKEISAHIEFMNNRENYKGINFKNNYEYLDKTDIMQDIYDDIGRDAIITKYHISNRTLNKFLEEHNIIYRPKKKATYNPTKEELIELLKSNTKSSIGKMFDVSCSAVIKWCKKYNLR